MRLSTPADFTVQHAWDRWFFPLAIVVIWVVILMGFVPQIIHRIARGAPNYPLIIYLHAAAFVGWLVLLSVQETFIRLRRYDIHRRVGAFGALLAVVMLVLGPWAAIVAEQVHFGTPKSDPSFLSIEFSEMIVFILLVGSAIRLRRDAAAHKRLMLLAVLFLTTAGFGRWLADPLQTLLGDGFLPFLVEFYGGTTVLVLGLGAYDLVTRKRLHPAYIAGATLGLSAQVLASWLYVNPEWKVIALKIIGH